VAKHNLREKIVSQIPKRRTGSLAWHERCPADVLGELEEIRDAWRAGEIESPKATLARAISRTLADLGIAVGPQGVIRWLANQ